MTEGYFFDIVFVEVIKIKDRIKIIRKEAGLTQAEFADKIHLSQNFIAQIETGKKNTSERTVLDICREFGINEHWLRTGEGNPQKETSEDFGEICGEIAKNDPKAKEAILKYAELSPADRELFWNFVERFIKQKAED